ncbi:MAG: EAL domain-containing protein [Lachnospiraceae bacterium]|nr:EAL domain-containing protein [Lachnospiraceae bacterium]
MRKFRIILKSVLLWYMISSALIFSVKGYAAPEGGPEENGSEEDGSQEVTEITVGYCENDDMIRKDEDGNFYGYGVSYLEELSQYTGWKYRYVKIPEKERISALTEGQVDLLCNVHKGCSQQEELLFSNNSSGEEYSMLCTWKENEEIFYDDRKAMKGKRIGISPDTSLENSLKKYAKQNGIEYEPVYIEEFEGLMEALQEKRVDMALVSSLKEPENYRYVGKISAEEVYFAVQKDHSGQMEELDKAIECLKKENPLFLSSIYKQFYGDPHQRLTGTTREEYEFILQAEPLRVACDVDNYPLEYIDEETGAYSGVYAAIMELISAESGLEFEFVPLKDFKEAWDMAAAGEIDLIARNYGHEKVEEYYHLEDSKGYLSVENVLIGRKGLEVHQGMSLALPEKYIDLRYFFQEEEPAWEVGLYDSIGSCLEAVNKGEADATPIPVVLLQTVYNLKEYGNTQVIPDQVRTIPISVGIGGYHRKELKSILDKAIDRIPETEFENCMVRYAVNITYEPTMTEMIKKILPYICVGLPVIVLGAIIFIHKRERHFQHLAMTDSVTGLWNRVKFYQEAQDILERNKDKTYLLITLDINKFKFINNDFGSKAGDKILYVLGERIRDIFAGRGYFARNTADVFFILIEEQRYQPAMLDSLNKAVYFDNNGKRQYYKIVVKAGIRVIAPEDDRTDLVLYVDQASLARKTIKDRAGSSQAYYDENMKRILEKENDIERRMEAALQNREFQVYLQPKYDLRSERIIGAEALVRWIHPEKGMIPPDDFIPLFEKNGFILKVDFYVYEEVLKRMAQWAESGKELICVSVNVSRVHISTADFFINLNRLMEKYKIPKWYFELELTETIMGGETSLTRAFIRECKKEGYKISIDDFGSGYSSLNLLKDLPVDILKIDKGFLDEAEESRRSNIIVEQVVEMAKRMEIKTLCEGVETRKQLTFLKKIGCDMAQGYLFSKPVPMDEFENLV